MATILQGQTFGTTEQVTNTKLHNLVANASISNIRASELISDILTSLPSAAGKLPVQNYMQHNTPATNASTIDVSLYTSLSLYYSTYGSLATFVNARTGQKFTLLSGQASFPVIVDAGSFLLSANWVPAAAGDNLTLIWDGTNFVEIGRVTV